MSFVLMFLGSSLISFGILGAGGNGVFHPVLCLFIFFYLDLPCEIASYVSSCVQSQNTLD